MDQIIKLINERTNFVLVGHTSPDGDTIGSCFAIAFALELLGKNVSVVLESYPKKYNIIPGCKFLHTGDLTAVDVLIALDCADIERLGSSQALFKRANVTVCIDHHKTNLGFAQLNYIEPDAASTCEMVFKLIEKLTPISLEIAIALYTGMICDTGGFKYNATNSSTMGIAAKLMATGIPFTEIYNEIMHKHTFAAAKAKGIVLQNCKNICKGRIVYSYITYEMLTSVSAKLADLDGIVEYLINTDNALMAVLVYEKSTTDVKVSFRSNGPDVSAVAIKCGGGGHTLAAGATTEWDIKTTLEKTLHFMEEELANYDRRT